MSTPKQTRPNLIQVWQDFQDQWALDDFKANPFRKLRGGLLLVLGYLLSPLCWWNDLVFNFPIAYAFGYCCRLVSPSWFVPGMIVGYWLTNLVGIVLMQFGAVDVLQGQSTERNFTKELLMGIATSTVYTLVVLLLVQLHVLDSVIPAFD